MRKKTRLNFSPSFLSQTDEHSTPSTIVYPHIRKIYNHETSILEYVHIVMSRNKPEEGGDDDEQMIGQRPPRRRARVSKQRAKILITEFCTGKIPSMENVKMSPPNKRHESSVCSSSHQSMKS